MSIYQQKRPQVYPKEFVRRLAENAAIPEEEAAALSEVFLKTIVSSLLTNHSICFPEFGIFELRESSERMGRNPKTMEEVVIPESLRPVFRASKALKHTVAEYAMQQKCAASARGEAEKCAQDVEPQAEEECEERSPE